MADDEKDRHVDALLDSLLSDYSAVEPRPGLDLRIRAGLRAHAARRRRQWMFVFAASAAVVVLFAMTTVRTPKLRIPAKVAAGATSAGPTTGVPTTALQPPAKAPSRFVNQRRARVSHDARSGIVLQLANAMPAAGHLVFEREKLYLSPELQPTKEPAVEPQTSSAPSIEVKDLGVQTIEIKDLPSVKGTDSKGNL